MLKVAEDGYRTQMAELQRIYAMQQKVRYTHKHRPTHEHRPSHGPTSTTQAAKNPPPTHQRTTTPL